MDLNEKRRCQRIDTDFNVRLSAMYHNPPFSSDTWAGNAINLSACGILVKTDKKVDVGETVTLKFLKPFTFDFFDGTGVVVRSEKEAEDSYVQAIDFLDLKGRECRETDSLIEQNYSV
ncbi:MAG: PilZ domain-containing protein [Desulfobacteraceae bacterium]|nr:PilZ domain-containing protein [Desulfobacteraceae bacterium]